jgi:hypothetical protein
LRRKNADASVERFDHTLTPIFVHRDGQIRGRCRGGMLETGGDRRRGKNQAEHYL